MTARPDIALPFVTAPATLRQAQRAAADARLAYERDRGSMTEAQIQRSIVNYLRLVRPDAIVHATENAVHGAAAGGRRKASGQIAGFPDLLVILPEPPGTLFLEVKTAKGRVKPHQRDFHERLQAMGHRVAVVRSIADTRAALAEWGVRTRERGAV